MMKYLLIDGFSIDVFDSLEAVKQHLRGNLQDQIAESGDAEYFAHLDDKSTEVGGIRIWRGFKGHKKYSAAHWGLIVIEVKD